MTDPNGTHDGGRRVRLPSAQRSIRLVRMATCGSAFLLLACQGAEADSSRPFPNLSHARSIGAHPLHGDVGRERSVVLVFAPDQCDAALGVIETFNELHAERGDDRIVGVVYTPYRQAALKALEAYDVSFPVLYDSLGTTREALDLYAYPALFLVEANRVVSRADLGGGDSDDYREILAAASAP